MKKFSMKAVKATKPGHTKAASHGQTKPRLKARHLSTIGKSAFGAVPNPNDAAFGPGGPPPAGGAPAFPPPGGGAPSGPMDAGAGALAGPSGGPPGM